MIRPIASLLFLVFAGLANGQSSFDAASVKITNGTRVPGVPFIQGGPGTSDPGRITYTQLRLIQILMWAWDVRQDQISGPAWLTATGGTDSYTITATMPRDTTKQQFQLMLQNLLAERFQMKLHHETRNFAGYELVVAPGGPKLKESADPDAPPPATRIPTGADKDGFALLPPGHGAGLVMSNGMHAKFQNYTMAELVATYMRGMVNQSIGADPGPIVDKTGLTGKYDFTLVFDPRVGGAVVSPAIRASLAGANGTETQARDSALDPGSGWPDIFNALEKQLGLKLVKVKDIPLDVIVIEHVEKTPLEN